MEQAIPTAKNTSVVSAPDLYAALRQAAQSATISQGKSVSVGDVVRRCVIHALPNVCGELQATPPVGSLFVGKFPTKSQLIRIAHQALVEGFAQMGIDDHASPSHPPFT